MKEDGSVATPSPRVHGWLTLICIYLRIILPILSILAAFGYYPIVRDGLGFAAAVAFVDCIARIIIAVVSFSAGTALYRISSGALRRARTSLVAIVTYNVLFIALLFIGLGPSGGVSIGMAVGSAIGTTLFPILALLYLRMSKRVAITYVSDESVKSFVKEEMEPAVPQSSTSRSTLGGWLRLWIAASLISFIFLAFSVFTTAQSINSSIANCIPEIHLQTLLVEIPAGAFHEMPSGLWFAFPPDSTREEVLKVLEERYPFITGKATQYVGEGTLSPSADADPKSRIDGPFDDIACPSGQLRPLPAAQAKYAKAIESTRQEILWRNIRTAAPIALLVWGAFVVGLYLCGMLIGWVIDGFRQRK